MSDLVDQGETPAAPPPPTPAPEPVVIIYPNGDVVIGTGYTIDQVLTALQNARRRFGQLPVVALQPPQS